MFCLVEETEELRLAYEKMQSSIARITPKLKPITQFKLIESDRSLSPASSNEKKVYLLREGQLQCWFRDKLLLHYTEGDIIGFENCIGLSHLKIISDFAVKVDEYSYDEIIKTAMADSLTANAWSEYLIASASYYACMTGVALRLDSPFSPEILNVKAGDTIIKQGESGEDAYNLAEGKAEVFVDGVLLGEIGTDEIFGAIAALTGIPRTATVRAKTDCLLFKLRKDKFEELIRNRPSTVAKLVSDLAGKLVALNRKVVDFQKHG